MKIRTLFISASIIALAAMITLNGCKKEQPAQPSEQEAVTEQAASTEEAAPVEDAAAAATETEQTVCPVMEGKINKDLFTEYKGKKVYFCCPGCEAEFNKNPEKYLSKLPQFQE